MNNIFNKEKLFQAIFNASYYNTLGFFVGAGFTKAVMEGNRNYATYRWRELIEKASSELGIDLGKVDEEKSNPEIATQICQILSDENKISIGDATKKFKNIIGRLTTIYPEGNQRIKYNKYFNKIKPTWVTTTNYDTVVESILGGRALTITPQNMYIKTANTTPVYHIHGICTDPEDIVITNNDYAKLFRPGEYRYSRVPFLLKESLVLLIGYRVGDLNVLTAIDWANNLYKNHLHTYEFPIIQLARKEKPREDIYEGENGILIYEIKTIESFFEELCEYFSDNQDLLDEKLHRIDGYIEKFSMPCEDEKNIKEFIQNQNNKRTETLEFLGELTPELGYVYDSFFVYINRALKNAIFGRELTGSLEHIRVN